MTFLPADSEGGQNIYLWIFFSVFFGTACWHLFGIWNWSWLGFVWIFWGSVFACFWHFFGSFFCCFWAFFWHLFCQVEFLNFPMVCPYVLFSHLLPHLHCIFNPFPLMPYYMAIWLFMFRWSNLVRILYQAI